MDRAHRTQLAKLLRTRAERIRELEARANHIIQHEHDQSGYEALMREKAELLATLAGDCGSFLDGISDSEVARLRAFSQSAQNSLRVGSVFYMSALLYPEDARPGEPNDLERFADELSGGKAR